jgi:Protein of unknown function (DUF2380)
MKLAASAIGLCQSETPDRRPARLRERASVISLCGVVRAQDSRNTGLAFGMTRLAPLAVISAFLALALSQPLQAQARTQRSPEAPTAPVAVLTAALYNDQANVREASDSAQAALATSVLRGRLADLIGSQVVPYPVIDSLAHSSAARTLAGGPPCHVKVECARWVAARAGARWAVMTKVSKTSNLIWLLSAQLIRVETGAIVLDDSTELKGEPTEMVRVGVRQFADRVARTVRAGGYVTNYPYGEPPYAPPVP